MKQQISIIGGGTAGLAVALFLDTNKFDVTIFEKNKTTGRKFLVAGKGGFNLTHSENIQDFIKRYTPSYFLENALLKFTNQDFRELLSELGIPTFIGSSKRVYPEKGIKPIKVLKSILDVLDKKNVKLEYNHNWNGWKNDNLLFNDKIEIKSDITIFALGGGSWKVTGSDGKWLSLFQEKGIKTNNFQASNCGFKINWKKDFIDKYEGTPLKNIATICNHKKQKGELVITKFGLEGNGIYALSPEIRKELNTSGKSNIYLDLKPTITLDKIIQKIKEKKQKNRTEILKKNLNLNSAQIQLLKTNLSKEIFLDDELLAKNIKALNLKIQGIAPIDEAISTVGGISLNQVDNHFHIKELQNNYAIGEMLDWDAPTGGYLLQGCFSMGYYLADYLNDSQY